MRKEILEPSPKRMFRQGVKAAYEVVYHNGCKSVERDRCLAALQDAIVWYNELCVASITFDNLYERLDYDV